MERRKITEVKFKGRKFKVTLYEESLKDIKELNWKWESLLFPDNNCDFVLIEEIGSNNIMCLTTNGFVRILDKNKHPMNFDDIIEVVKKGNIYDDYYICENNWFELDFGEKEKQTDNKIIFKYYDDDVFEYEPNNEEDLINYLLNVFVDFYKEN